MDFKLYQYTILATRVRLVGMALTTGTLRRPAWPLPLALSEKGAVSQKTVSASFSA